uniref:Cytochrome c oxidase subunit 3 n=1 Tax=Alloxysta sp. ZJUH_2016001 TaxID=2491149 RepID=A0A3S8V063_9HYME|nr:cytochrome c oxidase subunit 3 [Alloxysta sp. ZJUH_2016001]
MKIKFNYPFHMVSISPWPLLTSLSIFITLTGSIIIFNYKNLMIIFIGMISIMLCSFQWWRDTIRESTYQGFHTKKVYNGLKLGMFLFIISELMLFFSFFWAYFHSALSPNIELGVLWPPKNIIQFDPYKIPLLNTLILLSSGVTITWSHYSFFKNNKSYGMFSLFLTIMLGLIFTGMQSYEYYQSNFSLSDSIYGSLFFLTTGFHGLHVIIGTIFLTISLLRMMLNHFSSYHYFSFEASAWYWHFVDVIWLIVFTMVYWWNY